MDQLETNEVGLNKNKSSNRALLCHTSFWFQSLRLLWPVKTKKIEHAVKNNETTKIINTILPESVE